MQSLSCTHPASLHVPCAHVHAILLTASLGTPQSGTIRVSAHVLGSEHIEMSVVDTGIGVSQDKIDAIFRPYDQAGVPIV